MHKTADNEVLNSIHFQLRSTFVEQLASFCEKRFLFTPRRGNDSNCGEYVKMAKVDGVCLHQISFACTGGSFKEDAVKSKVGKSQVHENLLFQKFLFLQRT